jgi:hypothetical protein
MSPTDGLLRADRRDRPGSGGRPGGGSPCPVTRAGAGRRTRAPRRPDTPRGPRPAGVRHEGPGRRRRRATDRGRRAARAGAVHRCGGRGRGAWGFDLLPSETALASRESRRATPDEFILRQQLAPLDGYDSVLLDCPPSPGLPTINALAAGSRLVVVTEPSYLALQGIEELLDTSELVRTHRFAIGMRQSPPGFADTAGRGRLSTPH